MITVVRATGLVSVQDLGRPGRMHEAIPPGGALIPSLLVAANRRAGNVDHAPALEIFGRVLLRAAQLITVATDAHARTLAAGEELEVASDRHRAAYLALTGGIDTPELLGGRGALISARIGRILRTGDAFTFATFQRGIGSKGENERGEVMDLVGPVRVVPGPDSEAFEGDISGARYRVRADSDRVGTRLAGLGVRRRTGYVERSRPAVKGAIEVPGDGQPIVLGPEHPTTGGYPIVGVIVSEDLDRFFAAPLGSEITFTCAT